MRQDHKGATAGDHPARAFTLTELLVVTGVIAMLAAMRLPQTARTQERAYGIRCMSNLKQLATGCLMYAHDYGGTLLWPIASSTQPGWINGRDFVSEDVIRTSATFGYLGSTTVFRCPADTKKILLRGATHPANRSYSMNAAIGQSVFHAPNVPPYKFMLKIGDMTKPGPSGIYMLLDEHEGSINDSQYYPFWNLKTSPAWSDAPAVRHGNAAGFAFGDGHSEIHKWVDSDIPTTIGPPTPIAGESCLVGPQDRAWITNRIASVQ